MHMIRKFLRGNFKNEAKDSIQRVPDEKAVNLAEQYKNLFKEERFDELDALAEEVIEAAGAYWMKCDFKSFIHLLHAAEQSSYTYSGNKYPQILVEELVKKQREG